MDIRLGTRFYEAQSNGLVTPRVVLELPFKLSEDQFLDPRDAIADAIPKGKKALEKSDSISQHTEIETRLRQMGKGKRSAVEILKTLPVFYEPAMLEIERTVVNVDAIPKPGSYFLPKTKVWLSITPTTHYSMSPSWRPEIYFVLETIVQEVQYRRWGLEYSFLGRTYFHPSIEDVHGSAAGAVKALCTHINEHVPAVAEPKRVKILSDADERKWNDAQWEKLAARRERLAWV